METKKRTSLDHNKVVDKYMYLQNIFQIYDLPIDSTNQNIEFISSQMENTGPYLQALLEKKDHNSILILREVLGIFSTSHESNPIDNELFQLDLSVSRVVTEGIRPEHRRLLHPDPGSAGQAGLLAVFERLQGAHRHDHPEIQSALVQRALGGLAVRLHQLSVQKVGEGAGSDREDRGLDQREERRRFEGLVQAGWAGVTAGRGRAAHDEARVHTGNRRVHDDGLVLRVEFVQGVGAHMLVQVGRLRPERAKE